jgi:hypothetical protein
MLLTLAAAAVLEATQVMVGMVQVHLQVLRLMVLGVVAVEGRAHLALLAAVVALVCIPA